MLRSSLILLLNAGFRYVRLDDSIPNKKCWCETNEASVDPKTSERLRRGSFLWEAHTYRSQKEGEYISHTTGGHSVPCTFRVTTSTLWETLSHLHFLLRRIRRARTHHALAFSPDWQQSEDFLPFSQETGDTRPQVLPPRPKTSASGSSTPRSAYRPCQSCLSATPWLTRSRADWPLNFRLSSFCTAFSASSW